MASCQDQQVTTTTDKTELDEVDPVPQVDVESSEVAVTSAPPLAQAIHEEERKAAAKYGNLKKKQSDVMRRRMMGGGKQYFDSGDYVLNQGRPNAQIIPQNLPPEQPNPEKLRNRKASIPNKTLSRLS